MSLLCAFGQIFINELWLIRIKILARNGGNMNDAVSEPSGPESLNQRVSRWTGIKRLSQEEFEALKRAKEEERGQAPIERLDNDKER
jgi:hypothetical protein